MKTLVKKIIKKLKQKKPEDAKKIIIKNLKFMMFVFTAPIKGNPRIGFYQVKIMLFHGIGRKNSSACSFSLERK